MQSIESATLSAATHETAGDAPDILGRVDVPVGAASVTLTSGRRYEMSADDGLDHLTVRAANGRVLLCVVMTDNGPVLSFESADIRVAGTRRLALSANDISIDARDSLLLRSGGDCTQTITGSRHTRVDGAERLEARSIEVQASEEALSLRAAGKIALDGEHIGLNDERCPRPFAWSAIAGGPDSTATGTDTPTE